MNTNKVLSEAIDKISLEPAFIEKIKERAEYVAKELKKVGINVVIGGSVAKGTMLKKKEQDVDMFAVFEDEKGLADFENRIKKANFKGEFFHGSRDYFKIFEENIIFEVVPVLKITKTENAKNMTDFSLKHVEYIIKRIKKDKKLANEIKLAKSFCYANNCYGAESYIQGFSGYSLEILVCHFGSFVNFLKKMQKERVIDPEKYFKNEKEIRNSLNESKTLCPVILIDPTYKYRNVCAGLSEKTFQVFLEAAKKFMKNPSMSFFEKKEFSFEAMKKLAKDKKASFYVIEIVTGKQEGDIAATKMKKLFNFLIKQLENKEQIILANEFFYSGGREAKGYLVLKENKEIEIEGPSKDMEQAIKQFKKVRKNIYFKKGLAFAKEKVSVEKILLKQKNTAESMEVGFEFKKIE